MMLDINFAELREGFLRYLPVGALVGLVLLAELVLVFGSWVVSDAAPDVALAPVPGNLTNTHALGMLLYTDYLYLFQVAGLVLLVAMIGAIVLTLRSREGVRRQRIATQTARRREDVVEIKKIPTGSGA